MNKINYILGNPPFQDTKEASNGRKLYLDITAKMLHLFKDNLVFLTPRTIAQDKMKRLALNNIDGLKEVRYDIDNYFGVGVYIILFNIQKNYTDKVKIIDEDLTEHFENQKTSVVQEKDILPTLLFNRIKLMGSKQKDKLFVGDVSSNGFRRKTKDSKYKYEININTLKNKIEYTYIKPKLFGKKKIAIHMGAAYNKDNFIVSTKNYGQYQNMIDVNNYTENQINNIKSFLFNDLVVGICKKFRLFYGTGFNNIIYFFPNTVNINMEYTDNDIIEFFSLSQDEVNYINSEAPKRKKTKCREENLHYSKDRDKRVKDTAEVFTPDLLIQEMLNLLDVDWDNPPQDKLFMDPTCGSGNFLVAFANQGIPLCNIYGVDLMLDNTETCKKRLTEIFLEKGMELGDEDTEGTITYHLKRNIICGDALTYNYEFWWHNKNNTKNEKKQQDDLAKYKKKLKTQARLESKEFKDEEW